jgi:hypothetical protein
MCHSTASTAFKFARLRHQSRLFGRAKVDSGDYARRRLEHTFALVPAQAYVAKHLATYREFPPPQKPGSFSMDHVWRSSMIMPAA